MESSINERVNSALYSDVISSYVDINNITAQRNIVAGSFKESVHQCQDQTLATLNASAGNSLYTRLLLSPTIRNATLVQLSQVYFQYVIKSGTLGIAKAEQTANGNDEAATKQKGHNEHLRFKLFYDSGFSIASMVQLALVADVKVSTENFNYQQSLLTLNSLPDYVTKNSNSETTLSSLVENESFAGVGSGLIDLDVSANQYGFIINKDISIEGVIDLNRGNPLFHNFPIITRNIGQLYLRLYMENFLRELKIVYLNKLKNPGTVQANVTIPANTTFNLKAGSSYAQTANYEVQTQVVLNNAASVGTAGAINYLPYQRLPADKPDFVYLDGELVKVKLVVVPDTATALTTNASNFISYPPLFTSNKLFQNITWTRFEIRKPEFDVEDFEDIKASQAKSGVYKFPVHLWRSKNFDQTNFASAAANSIQTTLNAPNIDRLFITQPWNPNYYTFLPTPSATDINPQLHNNPVLPRSEDCLNIRAVERIGACFVDTDKYSIPNDLYNSLYVPIANKQLFQKGDNTYGGESAFTNLQRNHDIANNTNLSNTSPIFVPNKFAYGLELNAGGCFRRGFNSVIDGNYSPTVPLNLQQSLKTSKDIYKVKSATGESEIVNNLADFGANVCYGDLSESKAVSSVHCLCDYIFSFVFDAYGNMVDFGVSEYNDRA